MVVQQQYGGAPLLPSTLRKAVDLNYRLSCAKTDVTLLAVEAHLIRRLFVTHGT